MAISWEGEMDPSEVLDFEMDWASGAEPVLLSGEEIASFSLALTASAAAHGLQIKSGGAYDPVRSVGNTTLLLWLQVDPAEVNNTAFIEGIALGVEATIVTNSSPARTRQRTWEVTVKQL